MGGPGDAGVMVTAPRLRGMSRLLRAVATSRQLGMSRIIEIPERESLCKHILWLIHGTLATDVALRDKGKLLVFEALGDFQRRGQGDKSHMTNIEMCLYSDNAREVLTTWKAGLGPADERVLLGGDRSL